jgi:hypothetical protein
MNYYVCLKNIYCVGNTFIATESVDIFGKDIKRLAVCAQTFPSYQRVSSPPYQYNVIIRLRVQLNWI